MERYVLQDLLKWKNSPYRKPLILKGVRQVGKTWVLKEFGRRYYENTAYFNFDENEEYKQFFETTKDTDRILQNLMLASGQKILPEKTLIIFDEVQDCPKVINSMKYFCENAPQYHIACAGSLLGIALAKPASFPVGKVNFLRVDPMTAVREIKDELRHRWHAGIGADVDAGAGRGRPVMAGRCPAGTQNLSQQCARSADCRL